MTVRRVAPVDEKPRHHAQFMQDVISSTRDHPTAVLAMSQTAVALLEEWGRTPRPNGRASTANILVASSAWLLQHIGFGSSWCRGPGFWRAYARAGGDARISIMLTVAR